MLQDTQEGRNMLLRFQFAFLNGLCFSVGQSSNVEWTPFLPDPAMPTLIPNVMHMGVYTATMDQAFHIPKESHVCREWILSNQSLLLATQNAFKLAGTSLRAITEIPLSGTRAQEVLQNEVIHFDAASSRSSAGDRYAKLLDPVLCFSEGEKVEECSICLENMVPTFHITTGNVVCIKKCRHRFHKHCVMKVFELKHANCPNCREPLGIEEFGNGPSGTMTITVDHNKRCSGSEYDSDGVIMIEYNMTAGIQHDGMENPGQRYSGTQRVAYLPYNDAFRKLLARLKYAFAHGLTFRVGTSITSGKSNQITWSSIYHKTSMSGGPFGFPDAQFLSNCNQSLDELKVPEAVMHLGSNLCCYK